MNNDTQVANQIWQRGRSFCWPWPLSIIFIILFLCAVLVLSSCQQNSYDAQGDIFVMSSPVEMGREVSTDAVNPRVDARDNEVSAIPGL